MKYFFMNFLRNASKAVLPSGILAVVPSGISPIIPSFFLNGILQEYLMGFLQKFLSCFFFQRFLQRSSIIPPVMSSGISLEYAVELSVKRVIGCQSTPALDSRTSGRKSSSYSLQFVSLNFNFIKQLRKVFQVSFNQVSHRSL